MKTIFAFVLFGLLANVLGLKIKQFIGDQFGSQKGIGVQSGLGLGIGAAQVGFDKGIGVQSGLLGGAQIGLDKGIGAVQASPFNYGGFGWNGNGLGVGYGGLGFRGYPYGWRNYGIGYRPWGVGHGNLIGNKGFK